MEMAYEHYRAKNYDIDAEKCKTQPYDMECKKDKTILHVEVKGTQGLGEKIILTEGEVKHVENHLMELCVVSGIKVVNNGKTPEASGGDLTRYTHWNPRGSENLKCIAYRYTLPKQS